MIKNLIVFAVSLFVCQLLHAQESQQIAYHYNKVYDYENDTITTKKFEIDSLLNYADKFIGAPYVSPGRDPSGFDCSGFTFFCYRTYGVYLPYTAHEQAEIGEEIHLLEAKPGDLIFFQGHDLNDHKVHHVAIVTSKPGEKIHFIHSASHGVHKESLESAYYHQRFIEIRRVR
jgi:murein DD-endopeptidase / murein LD-carboxypeptidase